MKLSRLATLCLIAVGVTQCADGSFGQDFQEVHRVCATETAVRGIDVSVYQGRIDWPAVARGGVRFAIIRLASSSSIDTNFNTNWAGARSAGVIRGAYHYFNPHQSATTQANLFCDRIMAQGFVAGDLPPMLDVEYPQSTSNPLPSRAAYATAVRTYFEVVRRRLGVDPFIYTGGYYWDSYLATNEWAARPLAHAEYPNYFGPGDSRNTIYQFNVNPLPRTGCPQAITNSWTRWAFWQFAGDNGRAPGVTGPVDVDVFNGTMEQLRILARVPGAGVDAGVPVDAGRDAAVMDVAPPRDVVAPPMDAVVPPRDVIATADVVAPEAATDAAPLADAADVVPRDSSVGSEPVRDAAAADAGDPPMMRGGCGCRVGFEGGATRGGLSALAALLLLAKRRSRKSR